MRAAKLKSKSMIESVDSSTRRFRGAMSWCAMPYLRFKSSTTFISCCSHFSLNSFQEKSFVKRWIVHAAGLIVFRIGILQDDLASMRYIDPVDVGR